jgi:hypothetical protein
MKTGKTRCDLIGSFGFRDEFIIPAETIVQFGAPDCDGNPFNKWTLPESVARELSGNAHDAAHRFIVVKSCYVRESINADS